MESHGTVSIMKRRTQHKTTGQSLWRVPLSARSELHPHLWLNKLRPAGASQRRKARRARQHLSCPLVVTAGKNILTRHPCTGDHADLLCVAKKPSNCRGAGFPRTRMAKSSCACDCGRGPDSVGAFFFLAFFCLLSSSLTQNRA